MMELLKNKNTIIVEEKEGVEQQQFLFSMPLVNTTLLPRGIHIADLDLNFVKYVEEDLEVVVADEKVKVMLLSAQKFSEFMLSWDITDEKTKTPTLPIITIVRKPIAKQGTNFDKVSYNIPYESQYTVFRVPKTINGKSSYEYYQIPQPTNIDLSYEVNFFANRQRDINKLNELILKKYKSSQSYINVLGHYMATYLTGMEDNSKTEISARRYYHSKYSIDLKGYLLDENDFKIVKYYDKFKIVPEFQLAEKDCPNLSLSEYGACNGCLNITFPRKSSILSLEYKIPFNFEITSHNKSSLNDIFIYVNNEIVTIPFTINVGDTLKIIINQEVIEKKSLNLSLCGTKIID